MRTLEIIWRAIWLPAMILAFFLCVVVVFIRNGRRDATYLLELL